METKTVSKTFNEYEDFNVGDVVRLKSGGPSMTVDGNQGSRLDCTWFESGSNVIHRMDFHQGALEKVAVESPSA